MKNEIQNYPLLPSTKTNYNSLSKCIIFLLISSILQSIGSVFIKYLINTYTIDFNIMLFFLLRSLTIILLDFSYLFSNNLPIIKFNELPHKKWIILKGNLKFFSIFSFCFSLYYMRCFSAQSINTLIPIVGIILSFFFLNVQLSPKKISICLLCTIGVLFILINDYKNEYNYVINKALISGLIWSLLSLMSYSLLVLIKNKVDFSNINNHIHSIYHQCLVFSYSLLYLILTFKKIKFNFGFAIFSLLHGVNFFAMRFFTSLSMGNPDIKKYGFLNSLKILYVLGFCYILGEQLFYSDFIGTGIIISILIYDSASQRV